MMNVFALLTGGGLALAGVLVGGAIALAGKDKRE